MTTIFLNKERKAILESGWESYLASTESLLGISNKYKNEDDKRYIYRIYQNEVATIKNLKSYTLEADSITCDRANAAVLRTAVILGIENIDKAMSLIGDVFQGNCSRDLDYITGIAIEFLKDLQEAEHEFNKEDIR